MKLIGSISHVRKHSTRMQKSKLDTLDYSNVDLQLFSEELYTLRKAITFAEEAWDNRQTVPSETQLLLAETVSKETTNHGSGKFIAELKKYGAAKSKKAIKTLDALTSKQAGKILQGNIRDVLPIMEPDTIHEALFSGFYGAQCPNCDSYRIGETEVRPGSGIWKCICFKCEHLFSAKRIMTCPRCYIPLTEHNLNKIAKNKGKCISKDCTQTISFEEQELAS